MIEPRWEEEAALAALGLLEDSSELDRRATREPEVAETVRAFSATAAMLAYDAPQQDPPLHLRHRIMAQICAVQPEVKTSAKLIPFPHWVLPYAIAASLMGLAISQSMLIVRLHSQVKTEHLAMTQLQQSDSMLQLQLAKLETKNTEYINAHVMVAWDPIRHQGMISMKNMPAPPAGHEYQLWVLRSGSAAPVSAGLLTRNAHAQDFVARSVGVPGPGFAISMELAGGASEPTPGAILFAVAPGQ